MRTLEHGRILKNHVDSHTVMKFLIVFLFKHFSEEEGQAMLKLRDEADYKSLSKIGLVEPDDPAKALELGFPNRTTSTLSESHDLVADDDPVPMALDSFMPPDMPPMYHNPPICKFAVNPCIFCLGHCTILFFFHYNTVDVRKDETVSFFVKVSYK